MRKMFLFIAAVMCAASMSFAQEADTREVITSCTISDLDYSVFVEGVQNPIGDVIDALTPEEGAVWHIVGANISKYDERANMFLEVPEDAVLEGGWYKMFIVLEISGEPGTQYRFAVYMDEEKTKLEVDGIEWTVAAYGYDEGSSYMVYESPEYYVANSTTVQPAGAELTVYEYNSEDQSCANSDYIPFYGYYADAYLRAQYVMPASELEALNGNQIIQLRYKLISPETAYSWNSKVRIYLKEVDYTTLSEFDDMEGAQLVYEGRLRCDNNGNMSIFLTHPYTYQGGNLLVTCENIEKGKFRSSTFLGQTVNGASVSGFSYSSLEALTPNQRDFIPQTTFIYTLPPTVEEDGWVHYDTGEFKSAIGRTDTQAAFSWGIMIPAGTVTDTYLTKVSHYVSVAADVTVSIYQGGPTPNEATLLHTQDVTFTQTGVMEIINLNPSVEIDPTQDTWIVFNGYAASYSVLEGAVNGRWIEDNGELKDIADLTSGSYIDIAWMIRGLFASEPEYHPYVVNIEAKDIAATSANVSWEGLGTYELRYKKHIAQINNSFLDENLGEWTTIDADGDGHNWVFESFYDGAGISSASWFNDDALTPNNYLVSPKFVIGDSITFEAWGQDPDDFMEHFGVAVSTTSNTDPEAFTTIQEWDIDYPKTWKKYTVDLSAYKGQKGYVAIRHFNCTDQFWLLVRNVNFYPNPDPEQEDPEWTVVSNINEAAYALSQLEPDQEYWVEVRALYENEATDWSKTYKFRTLEEGTGIEQIVDSRESKVGSRKMLHDGQLYILRDGKIFNAQGARVK